MAHFKEPLPGEEGVVADQQAGQEYVHRLARRAYRFLALKDATDEELEAVGLTVVEQQKADEARARLGLPAMLQMARDRK